MTFLLQLRNALKECSNIDYRETMKRAADTLDERIEAFTIQPDREAIIALNGAWAYAERVLKNKPEEGTPAPLSGPTEPARLAA